MNQENYMKKNTIKGVKAWAVCFGLNKKCLMGDIPTFKSRAGAKRYIKELHQKIGGFEDDHHIIKVLITPITKVAKKHICCDGECNHDDCCGKVEANCPNYKVGK